MMMMKHSVNSVAAVSAAFVVVLALAAAAQAAPTTYYIVDYPAFQTDSVTGFTDHISGTIIADPDTGLISSASFTLTGASGSYTCDSAVIDSDLWMHVTPTQIYVDRNNSADPYGRGYFGLRSSNPAVWPFMQVYWHLQGEPFQMGIPYDIYHAEYKTGKTSLLVNFGADPFPVNTVDDVMVIATVPEPATMGLLGLGLMGLFARGRKQRK